MNVSRLNFKSLRAIAGALFLSLSFPVFSDWSTTELNENTTGMDYFIYTPDQGSGPRALMLALHGCDQSNDEIRNLGNLKGAADAYNAVIVVPWRYTPWSFKTDVNCWAYSGSGMYTAETQPTADALITFTEAFVDDTSLNIDPSRVYITGLSSGGAMAQYMGCYAPDIFSGVGSVAGPPVGSDQLQATSDILLGIDGLVTDGTALCNSLAASRNVSGDLSNQIANIGWGERDRQGNNSPVNFNAYGSNTQGKTALVSVKYSHAAYEIFQNVYGSNAFDSADEETVSAFGGTSVVENSSLDVSGNVRVSYLSMWDVGHAWPSGDASKSGQGGTWMAYHDIDYSSYILNWFEANNMRQPTNAAPVVTIDTAVPSADSISITCSVTDPDGTISRIDSELILNGSVVDSHTDINNCDDSYTGLADGYYKVKVIAYDDAQAPGSDVTASLEVGNPPDNPPIVSVTGSANGQNLTATGTVEDDLGLTSVTADLLSGGSVVDSQAVSVAGDDSFSVTFSNVAEGTYVIRITAVDNGSQSESASTDNLESVDVGSTGNVQFHIDEGHITFGVGYSTCFLEYGSSAAFTMTEVDLGGGSCRWEDDDASCYGPSVACSGGATPTPTPVPPTPTPTVTVTPTPTPVPPTPTPQPGGDCFTDSNYAHVQAGRATMSAWSTYAVGSGDAMGLYNTYTITTLVESSPGYYQVGTCP